MYINKNWQKASVILQMSQKWRKTSLVRGAMLGSEACHPVVETWKCHFPLKYQKSATSPFMSRWSFIQCRCYYFLVRSLTFCWNFLFSGFSQYDDECPSEFVCSYGVCCRGESRFYCYGGWRRGIVVENYQIDQNLAWAPAPMQSGPLVVIALSIHPVSGYLPVWNAVCFIYSNPDESSCVHTFADGISIASTRILANTKCARFDFCQYCHPPRTLLKW